MLKILSFTFIFIILIDFRSKICHLNDILLLSSQLSLLLSICYFNNISLSFLSLLLLSISHSRRFYSLLINSFLNSLILLIIYFYFLYNINILFFFIL